ncbi:hypothetical protein ABPG77_001150 [Micractinium sp. CCAP 211/92]
MPAAAEMATPLCSVPTDRGMAAAPAAAARTSPVDGIAAAASSTPPHPPLPLALRLDQLAKLLMVSGQAMVWLGHIQKAEGLVNKLLPGVVTALMLVNVLIVWGAPRFYWRHRAWLAPALRIVVLLPPSTRSAVMGTALIMDQPPRLGLKGFLGDMFRIFTGTRLLATFLGGIIILHPPATALLTQCCVVALTFHPAGYCSTQLLRHPLWAGRLARAASALELLTVLPMAAALPLASSSMRVLAGAELDPAATCRAAVSFMQLFIGVAVPMLVATWLWQPCEGAAQAGAGVAGMDAPAAGDVPAASAAPLQALLGGRLGKLGSAAARRAAAADHWLHGWLVGPHRLVAAWFVCGVLWSASKATSGLL